MKQYVLMIKEGERIYGRIPEENGTSGFIVFLHKNVEEQREGLYQIDSVEIKENGNKKFGFIKGTLVEPEDFDVNNLTPEQLYYLAAVGYIYDLYEYNDKPAISIKNPNHLDNIYTLAFMVDGKFAFINKLKYLDNTLVYIKDMYEYEKNLFKMGLSTKSRAISHPIKEECKCLSDDSLMKQNQDKLIWRKVFEDNKKEFGVVLYKCSFIPFNDELYQEILNYNKAVNKELRENSSKYIKNDNIKNKVYKLLSFYGLYESN